MNFDPKPFFILGKVNNFISRLRVRYIGIVKLGVGGGGHQSLRVKILLLAVIWWCKSRGTMAGLPPKPFESGDGSPETILENFVTFYEDFKKYLLSMGPPNTFPENAKLHMALGSGGEGLRGCLVNSGKQDITSNEASFSSVFEETLMTLKQNKRANRTGPPKQFQAVEDDPEATLDNFEDFFEDFKVYIASMPGGSDIPESAKLHMALGSGGPGLREFLLTTGKQELGNGASFTTVFEGTLDKLKQKNESAAVVELFSLTQDGDSIHEFYERVLQRARLIDWANYSAEKATRDAVLKGCDSDELRTIGLQGNIAQEDITNTFKELGLESVNRPSKESYAPGYTPATKPKPTATLLSDAKTILVKPADRSVATFVQNTSLSQRDDATTDATEMMFGK